MIQTHRNTAWICPSTRMDPLQARSHLEGRKLAAAHHEAQQRARADAAYRAHSEAMRVAERAQ